MKLKFGRKRFTFVLISDANSSVKRFKLSEISLWFIAALIFSLILTSVSLYYIQVKNSTLSHSLQSQLQHERDQMIHAVSGKDQTIEELQNQVLNLSQQAQDVKAKMDEIKKLEDEVKSITNTSSMKSKSSKDAKNIATANAGLNDTSNRKNTVRTLAVGGPDIPVTNEEVTQLADSTSTDFSALEDEIAQLQDNLSQAKDSILQKQHLWAITPNIWPVNARDITSGFGVRTDPFTRRINFHDGVDIGASYGTAIYATADGVVISAGYSGSRGNNVVIDHSRGIRTEYMHMSAILVERGEKVKKGQKIGLVGSTGRSTGPHLHYGVIKFGSIVNPMPYLP